jgi:glycosyltransferase involved in cell wall biosynthesis
MRIAMIAPPWFPVPPLDYGGTERVCALLAKGLVDRGHDLTLFATGDSTVDVPLESAIERHDPDRLRWPEVEARHLAHALELLDGFDVVHDNSTVYGPLLLQRAGIPVFHTVHGGLEDDDARAVYRSVCSTVGLIAISKSYAAQAPELEWAAAIHNPVDADEFPFVADKQDYVVFLGRMAHAKGPDIAIRAALEAGIEIRLAGPVHEPNRLYFDSVVRPLLDEPGVELLGPVGGREKAELLANARALISPVQWDEPFGLAPVEAMACGTPVVAFARGALRETILDGETGIFAAGEAELPAAIEAVGSLDPWRCRSHVVENFSTATISASYEAVLEGATVPGEVLASRTHRFTE